MAIDQRVAEAVRAALRDAPSVREVKMFGGLGFMLGGNLLACASARGLLVRVGEAGKADAVTRGAAPMVMNGREMKGFVWINEAPLDARTVKAWVREARAFVETLPAKGGTRSTTARRPKLVAAGARPARTAPRTKATPKASAKPAARRDAKRSPTPAARRRS